MLKNWQFWLSILSLGALFLIGGLGGRWAAEEGRFDSETKWVIRAGAALIVVGVVGIAPFAVQDAQPLAAKIMDFIRWLGGMLGRIGSFPASTWRWLTTSRPQWPISHPRNAAKASEGGRPAQRYVDHYGLRFLDLGDEGKSIADGPYCPRCLTALFYDIDGARYPSDDRQVLGETYFKYVCPECGTEAWPDFGTSSQGVRIRKTLLDVAKEAEARLDSMRRRGA